MGPLGWQETVFIFFLALLIFGPKKLPELGKTLGKAMTEFRRASNELKTTFDREMRNLEAETESLKQLEAGSSQQYQPDTYNYEYSSYDANGNYEGATGENYDSTAQNSSTASASATQGAESHTAVPPEDAAHKEGVTAVANEPAGSPTHSPAAHDAPPAPDTAGHNA